MESIGTAKMLGDGTIVMNLRAQGPGGVVGDAQVRYPKTHPNYAEVLAHLGGMNPGEEKSVPPWPE